jgi:hypothetical protein
MELFKTTCKRCGKPVTSSENALKHPLGRICQDYTTPDEKQQILEYTAGLAYAKAKGKQNV